MSRIVFVAGALVLAALAASCAHAPSTASAPNQPATGAAPRPAASATASPHAASANSAPAVAWVTIVATPELIARSSQHFNAIANEDGFLKAATDADKAEYFRKGLRIACGTTSRRRPPSAPLWRSTRSIWVSS